MDKETKELFLQTGNMLDQILETFNILENNELVKEIKQGENKYKDGLLLTLE